MLESFVTCSEHGYAKYRRALKPSEDKEDRLWCRREREMAQCARETCSRSKAGNINEVEGEREGWTCIRDRQTKPRKVEKADGEIEADALLRLPLKET